MNTRSLYIKIGTAVLMSAVILGCQKKEALYEDKGADYFIANASFSQMSPTPANASTGTAELTARFDNNSRVFNYWLKWKNMSSLVTRADFYFPSKSVQNGWLQRNIFTAATPRAVTDSISGYIFSNTSLSEQEVADMKAGKVYYQIVTQTNTGGEIRGYFSVK